MASSADVFKNGQASVSVLSAKIFHGLGIEGLGHFPGEINSSRKSYPILRKVRLPRCRDAACQMRLARAAGAIKDQRIEGRQPPAENPQDGRLDEAVFRPGEELQLRRRRMAVPLRRMVTERLSRQRDCHHAIDHFGSVQGKAHRLDETDDYTVRGTERGAGSKELRATSRGRLRR